MNLHTPVIFTDDPAIQALALDRNWAVVERHPGNPSVLRIPGVSTLCTMPQPRMSIADGSLDAASTPTWNYVLNWVARFVHQPLPVVAANDYATELALWAAASRGWPLGALIAERPDMTPQATSLFTSADGFFLPDPHVAAGFVVQWPGPVGQFEESALVELAENPPKQAIPGRTDVTKVLLTTYHGGSATGGSERVTQWFQHIGELSGGRIDVDLALAAPWPGAPANVHLIPDYGVANLTTGERPLEPWARALLKDGANSEYQVRFTKAGLWHLALEKYFGNTGHAYDAVICSGGPYSYYDFAHYAKRRWYARTILDYPEPFANNPETQWEPGARTAATRLEAGWNMGADLVLAASETGSSLVVPGTAETRVEVVPSGRGTTDQSSGPDAITRLVHLIESVSSHEFHPPRL